LCPVVVRDGFAKYVTFRGRSSRPAYWWWYLFVSLVFLGATAGLMRIAVRRLGA